MIEFETNAGDKLYELPGEYHILLISKYVARWDVGDWLDSTIRQLIVKSMQLYLSGKRTKNCFHVDKRALNSVNKPCVSII